MVDQYKGSSASERLEGTKTWISVEIIGKGYCPPLAIIANETRDEKGEIDWTLLEQRLLLKSYDYPTPFEGQFFEEASNDYLSFIENSINGSEVLSGIFILPDFPSNGIYDGFMNQMKLDVLLKLADFGKIELVKKAIRRSLETRLVTDPEAAKAMLRELEDSTEYHTNLRIGAALQLIDGMFRPSYFYGRDLSAEDLIGLASGRGPAERQKVLSRSPYYCFQVVNTMIGTNIAPDMNKQELYKRNTEKAQEKLKG